MKRLILKTLGFLVFTCGMYVCLTGFYYQNPQLKTRWNQGIPNWIPESNLAQHLSVFEAFCQEKTANRINLILGSSTALHGISPEYLGDNWYSLATRGQHPAASEIILDLALAIAKDANVGIDTLMIDVYPEFSQEWVYAKSDAYEHMALTLNVHQILRKGRQVFVGGGFRRLHNALSYRLFAPKIEFSSIDRIHGYEMHPDTVYNYVPPLPWDGLIHRDCQSALQRFGKKENTTIFICPPVLHENHCEEVSRRLGPLEEVIWLDANDNLAIRDSNYFFDDHHLNHNGAIQNTLWIQSQLR